MRKPGKWLFFFLRNRLATASITNPSGAVDVSLTSHGSRLQRVFCTIESIGLGTQKPRSITLFVGQHDAERTKAIASLSRLKSRGLTIVVCEDVKPHTKYFPFLLQREHFTLPLVTADDDVFYPKHWLEDLQHSYEKLPECIHCHRAKEIQIKDGKLAAYREWKFITRSTPSHRAFLTGVSGAIYPPRFLHKLKEEGDPFKIQCPTADDVWLNAIAVKHDFKVKQIRDNAAIFDGIPGSSKLALVRSNNEGGGNDLQIANTYTEALIQKIAGDQH